MTQSAETVSSDKLYVPAQCEMLHILNILTCLRDLTTYALLIVGAVNSNQASSQGS